MILSARQVQKYITFCFSQKQECKWHYNIPFIHAQRHNSLIQKIQQEDMCIYSPVFMYFDLNTANHIENTALLLAMHTVGLHDKSNDKHIYSHHL